MLDVSGMMCGGCSAAVKNILLKQPGVQGAAVNLITHAAAVTVRWVLVGEGVTASQEAAGKQGKVWHLQQVKTNAVTADGGHKAG